MQHQWMAGALLALHVAACLTSPILPDDVDSNVDKRTLADPSELLASGPLGFYSAGLGVKPLLPPGFFVNRLATPPPPVDPMAAFFKARKDEFLNKLFEDITMETDTPTLGVRSAILDSADDAAILDAADDAATSTAKPKIDASAFKTKKFGFLTALFNALNSTTVAPATAEGDSLDSTASTVKPTIVPPGFWAPVTIPPKVPKAPKAAKAPKATKPPKPEKAKSPLLEAIDEGLLKSVLAQVDPENAVLAPKSAVETRQATFLDKLLHRVTDAPPTEAPETEAAAAPESRSLAFPPGYWIPPYIYAAKMGIYLDKMFDTIDKVAVEDSLNGDDTAGGKRSVDPSTEDAGGKRSVATADPSSLILAELTTLKDKMVAAYVEGLQAAKMAAVTAKPAAKKPIWGPKTTPKPDPAQEKAAILSDVFDQLAALQAQILAGTNNMAATAANLTSSETTPATPTTSFWAVDPAAVDVDAYYKTKTQEFLSNLFSSKMSTVAPTEDD